MIPVQYNSTDEAQQAVINFHRENEKYNGRIFTVKVGSEDPITATISQEMSCLFSSDQSSKVYHGLNLATPDKNGDTVRRFASRLVENKVPVFWYRFFGSPPVCSVQYVPESFGKKNSTKINSFSSKVRSRVTQPQVTTGVPKVSHISSQKQEGKSEAVELKNETFTEQYRHMLESKILAEDCQFADGLLAKQDVHLKKSSAGGGISSQHGSIVCISSNLEDIVAQGRDNLGDISILDSQTEFVDARKGSVTCTQSKIKGSLHAKIDVTCKNSELQDVTSTVKGNISLFDSTAANVSAKEGDITWKNAKRNNCASGEVRACKGSVRLGNFITDKTIYAMGSAELDNSEINTLTITVPKAPVICIHLKNNATIHGDIIIEEDSAGHIYDKRSREVSGGGITQLLTNELVGSFSCPRESDLFFLGKSKANGVVLNASGRVGGIPYQFINGEYKPGVKIIIFGEGSVEGQVIYKNCTPVNGGISLGAKVKISGYEKI